MPKPLRPIDRSALATKPSLAVIAATLAAVSLAASGLGLLAFRFYFGRADQISATAAVVLLCLSLVQLRLIWLAWQRGQLLSFWPTPDILGFAARMLAGGFLIYVGALFVGPLPGLGYAWLAALAAWYTLLLVVALAAPRNSTAPMARFRLPAARGFSRALYASMLLLIAAEAVLSGVRLTREQGWFNAAHPKVVSDLVWDGQGFVPPGDDKFRVAILGAEGEGDAERGSPYLARIEQMLPSVEIVHFDVPNGRSSGSMRAVNEQMAEIDPDLVLAVVAVCEDLVRPAAARDWFDVRQFELSQWLVPAEDRETVNVEINRADDFESLLFLLAPQLAACRTPIDHAMRAKWQETFQWLEQLQAQCTRRQVQMALVLVPGEFQVNPRLCDTLARRTGTAPEAIDVELPQRQWAGFAAGRELPLIDLLPNLRLCRQSPYERNATVWNEQGHAVAASAIGGWLESRFGRQLSVAARLSSAP